MQKDECVFCEMFNEDTDETMICITPLNPVVEGHKIVIPREHVADFTEDMMITSAVMMRAAFEARMAGGEYNLITSKGFSATQSIFHLHVHLVPRQQDDGLKLPWTDQQKAKKLTQV